MTEFRRDADTREIAKALVYIADTPEKRIDDVEMGLYNLRAICKNDLNFDFYRTTYDTIVEAVEALQRMGIVK